MAGFRTLHWLRFFGSAWHLVGGGHWCRTVISFHNGNIADDCCNYHNGSYQHCHSFHNLNLFTNLLKPKKLILWYRHFWLTVGNLCHPFFLLTLQSYDDFLNYASFLTYFSQKKPVLLTKINDCVRTHIKNRCFLLFLCIFQKAPNKSPIRGSEAGRWGGVLVSAVGGVEVSASSSFRMNRPMNSSSDRMGIFSSRAFWFFVEVDCTSLLIR